MAHTSLQGNACQTHSALPSVGSIAPDFTLLNTKMKAQSLSSFAGKRTFIYTVPSLDTMVCADTVKQLNELAGTFNDNRDDKSKVNFIVVSADLIFAQQRYRKENKIKKVKILSMMRSKQFAEDFGVLLIDGPLEGLAARAVFVLDDKHKILHQELVSDITHAPDFDAAFSAL